MTRKLEELFFNPATKLLWEDKPSTRKPNCRQVVTQPNNNIQVYVAKRKMGSRRREHKDYVTTSKQATTHPDCLRRVNWLLLKAENGRFRGPEIELCRTFAEPLWRCFLERGRHFWWRGSHFFNRMEEWLYAS